MTRSSPLKDDLQKVDEETRERLQAEEDRFEDIYDYQKVFQMVCSNPATKPAQEAKERELTSDQLLAGSYSGMFKEKPGSQVDVAKTDGGLSIGVYGQAKGGASTVPALGNARSAKIKSTGGGATVPGVR